jgi:hypothetical protein
MAVCRLQPAACSGRLLRSLAQVAYWPLRLAQEADRLAGWLAGCLGPRGLVWGVGYRIVTSRQERRLIVLCVFSLIGIA